MPDHRVLVDGAERDAADGTTGLDLYRERRDVVAMTVDGELRDLAAAVRPGQAVEAVTIGSPEGLAVLRHSCAHVLAQAVQEINPQARLGIGPPITDGFYYDFDVETPFTPEDLTAVEKVMARIVREGQHFRRRVVTEDEARTELAAEPYKLELIGLKGSGADAAAAADGASMCTMYIYKYNFRSISGTDAHQR